MKKFFLIILVFCMCISILSSCGNNDSTSKGEIDSTQTSMDSAPTEIKPTETVESTADKSKEISGILVAKWDCRDNNVKTYVDVVSINPETGEETSISSFMYDEYYKGYRPATYLRYTTDREIFSSDFKKAIVNINIADKGYSCAGWIDENGNVFNVTQALGLLPTSDFSNGCRHYATGFIGNYFTYLDLLKDQYYAVPVDNIAAENVIELTVDMEEFVPSSVKKLSKPNFLRVGRWETCYPSDVLNDGRVIVGEYIVSPSTGEKISYIPGGNRTNWDAMANPDGNKLCFFSTYGEEKTGLYIVDLAGGDPVEVNCNLPESTKYNGSGKPYGIETEPGYNTNHSSYVCSMIDWVE